MAQKAGTKGSTKRGKTRKVRDLSVRSVRAGDAAAVRGGASPKLKVRE